MSGIVIRLAQRNTFIITAPSTTTVVQIPVARRVDTSQYQNGIVVVRLHTSESFVTNQNVQLAVAPDPFTDEDPNQNWSGTSATTLVTFTGGTDSAPSAKTANLSTPFASLLMFSWFFNITVATNLKVSLSADLHLKNA